LRGEDSVTDSCRCTCCCAQLEPAQELRFLVETANLDNPRYLARIRRLPHSKGRPVPVCSACQKLLESSALSQIPVRRRPTRPNAVGTGVLAVVGLLSVGWLIQNLLFGPRA
jgi:hypothetical protein